jgi:SOS-response transcriptional repressor LexA
MEANAVRPTKKQRELLGFIESFIKEHGYSPSYREIMNGLGYTSVATVALHVSNLIKRGHLRKRDHSARSLEIIGVDLGLGDKAASILEHEAKWLIEQVHVLLAELEASTEPITKKIDDAYVLIGALHVLGLDDAVRSLVPRLSAIKVKVDSGSEAID